MCSLQLLSMNSICLHGKKKCLKGGTKMGYISRKWQNYLLATGRSGPAPSSSIEPDFSLREPQECTQLRKFKVITQNLFYALSELVSAQLV